MAGRIPQSFIDDLVVRADIVEVLGTRIELKKAGREYKALCPFHGEKTPSFTVSPDKGFYHCFGCGMHGTALGFLMEHDHLSFVDAVEELAAMLSMEVPREQGHTPRDSRVDQVLELLQRVEQFYIDALRDHPPAIEYLKNRGIDGVTARDYRIGYAPAGWDNVLNHFGAVADGTELLQAAGLIIAKDGGGHYDRFRDRLMFPIRDARGRTVGFGGRVLGDGEPKYLNSPETTVFHKGRELYGLYEARQKLRDIEQLVVVEGYMDVVGLARHGIRYAVATLGTSTTPEQLERLFRLTDVVTFSFDGDRAGRKAAWRAMENALPKARDGRQIRFAFMPEGQDPDSLVASQGAAAFESLLAQGLPLSDFIVQELIGQVDRETVEGRARFAELARPLLGRIPEGVFRELLLQQMAEMIGLAPSKLAQMMGSAPEPQPDRPQRRRRPPGGGQRPTLMRQAISLLLHHPDAAARCDPADIALLDRPGADLLRALMLQVGREPGISPAVLLERWREHPHGQHLQRLAAELPMQHDDMDPAAEFAGCMRQLKALARRDRVEALSAKSREDGLTADEKSELRELLAQGRE
jgi:DNA primase